MPTQPEGVVKLGTVVGSSTLFRGDEGGMVVGGKLFTSVVGKHHQLVGGNAFFSRYLVDQLAGTANEGGVGRYELEETRTQCPKCNLPISVKTDSINKGSKIIFASSVDGNSLKTITDPKAITGMPGSLWERKWLTPRCAMGFRAIERCKGVHHTTIAR
jgi:hypothetical protein